MSQAKFFSNSVIMLDHRDNEFTLSLKNTRVSTQRSFSTPVHNVGTPNLMVFVEGRLYVPERDYIDIDSSTIMFTRNIQTNEDVHIVLIKTSKDISGEGSVVWESF